MALERYIEQGLEGAERAPWMVLASLAGAASFLAFYPHVSTYHNPWVVGIAVFLDCLTPLRVAFAVTAWVRRRTAAAPESFFLTPQEGQSVWGILTQSDSRRTSFVHAVFMAKNRTGHELSFARAVLLRPKLGPTLRPLITVHDGTGMSSMVAGGTHFLTVDLAFEVVPEHTDAMNAVIEVADSDGNAQKVKLRLLYLPPDASRNPANG